MTPNSGQSSRAPGQRVNATLVPWTPSNPPPPRTNSSRLCLSRGSVNRFPTVLFRNTASKSRRLFAWKTAGSRLTTVWNAPVFSPIRWNA